MSDQFEIRTFRALQNYRQAILAGDQTARSEALGAFEALIDFVVPSERRRAFRAARTEMDVMDADIAFKEFGRIANEHFAPLSDAFRLGQTMADTGRQGLFFPRAAAHLSAINGILKELSATAESVENSLGDLEDAFTAKDATALVEEADQVQTTIDDLVEKLASIQQGLSA